MRRGARALGLDLQWQYEFVPPVGPQNPSFCLGGQHVKSRFRFARDGR